MATSANFDGAMAALGTVEGVSAALQSKTYADSMIKATFAQGEKEFFMYMDALALSNPKKYHHVYDWGMTGNPMGRLFRLQLTGRGGHRRAELQFLPSMKYVPEPEVVRNDSRRYKIRRYRFHNKAAVMEFGIPVTIAPKRAERLFLVFPKGTAETNKPERNFIFSDGPIQVDNPGGDVAGRFTAAYLSFWQNAMPEIFEAKVQPRLEKDIRNVTTKGLRYAGTKARRGKQGERSISLSAGTAKLEAKAEMLRQAARTAREEALDGRRV